MTNPTSISPWTYVHGVCILLAIVTTGLLLWAGIVLFIVYVASLVGDAIGFSA